MNLDFKKRDKYGQELNPGDIVAISRKDKVELLIYKEEVYGGKKGGGFRGRFEGLDGKTTVKYDNVVFVLDPMGERKAGTPAVKELIRRYYG